MEAVIGLALFGGIFLAIILVMSRRVAAAAEVRFSETSDKISVSVRKRKALRGFWGVFGGPAMAIMTGIGWKFGEFESALAMFVISLAICAVFYMPYSQAIKAAAKRAEERQSDGIKPVLGNWG